MGRDGLI